MPFKYIKNKKFILFFIFHGFLLVTIVLHCHSTFASEVDKIVKTQMQENENLLLRPKIGRIIYDYDIYALYRNGRIYYSVSDLIDILEFSIEYNNKTQKGQGWFLQEDWQISIDIKNNRIISKNKEFQPDEDDIIIDDDIVFIDEAQASQWFDMVFKADIEQQFVNIESDYPLPAIARIERQNKKIVNYEGATPALLPRYKENHQWFDMNTANIRLGSRYRQYDGKTNLSQSGTLSAEGQMLKHDMFLLIGADSRNKINNVTSRLSKKDEDAVLLGPLKARSYMVGDINLTDLNLTGDAGQEFGFRVSDSALNNIEIQSTDISGNGIQGWDVELYRNSILISSIVIGEDGYYEFSDVNLFAGDNLFELFFYGPQGEIRRKKIEVPVSASLLAAQDGYYDISISLSDTKTYQKNSIDNDDVATPHLVARYNKSIGDMLAYVGFRSREIEGVHKNFIGAGFTTLAYNAVIDGNFGLDEKGNAIAQIIGRRNINKWNLSADGTISDKDYQVEQSVKSDIYKVGFNAQRAFVPTKDVRTNILTNFDYIQMVNDVSQVNISLGSSVQKNKFSLSNNLLYRLNVSPETQEDYLKTSLAGRANFGKYFIRSGLNYNFKPTPEIESYFMQANYYPTQKISGDIRVDYKPNQNLIETRLGMNYTNKYFRTSPYIEIDNKNQILAGLNLNFNLIDTPYATKPTMTSKPSIGRGLISSFVYYDKNGNNIYDNDDAPLPEVIVESVNIKRRVETNENGYSLISDLPIVKATDIQIDPLTLPDPYMISGFDGASIYPNAGQMVELNFPIHMSGEIDGTVFVKDKKGDVEPFKKAEVLLYPLRDKKTGAIKTKAAFDGFYVASLIPPGQYIMTLSNDTAKKAKAGLPPPRLVNIGYEGDVIYGSNFELDKGQANVPIEVIYNENPSDEVMYGLKTPAQPQTKLLSLLADLKKRQNNEDVFKDLNQIKQVENGDKIYQYSSNDLEASHEKCRNLAKNAIPCVLQIYIPVQMKPVQTAQTSLL